MRTFSTTPEYYVIYDAGVSLTRVTVISFAATGEPKTKASYMHFNVLSIGHDRNTRDKFMSKHRQDIQKDRRTIAQLWKEAGCVNAILSANSDATSAVESVAFDIDFKTKVACSEFEDICNDLHPRFARPTYDALANADLSLANISFVILKGGNSCTPMVKCGCWQVSIAYLFVFGPSEFTFISDRIALNVNADESAMLGAALYGASLFHQFKTKDICVTDVLMHDIQSYLLGRGVVQKRLLMFKRKDDFSVILNYPNEVMSLVSCEILEAKNVGICEAIDNLTEHGTVDPVIKATVVLSESGFVSVGDAIVYGKIKDDSITATIIPLEYSAFPPIHKNRWKNWQCIECAVDYYLKSPMAVAVEKGVTEISRQGYEGEEDS
ncbi:uncharacterized protein F5891DRAFT_1214806 [Suillus fuscotomentosus]|uniref:Uncharacterized protein n=1 Tax=Suillus fuscotomentosus TaxID=1912939 RepID=A0AAD4HBV8_9AGAM|nr:uncharacterized protein F5891DRAFT_1214806 [Suillus fuscotomentosus]KAG1889585.1 hypothetical protein F5891DRAFT_1214806 [Suillus fuscotomentosus]